MKRRDFIAGVGSREAVLCAVSAVARGASDSSLRRCQCIGFLAAGRRTKQRASLRCFGKRLAETGYVPGPECQDRAPLGRWSYRATAGSGGRARCRKVIVLLAAGGRHRPGGQGSNILDPDRFSGAADAIGIGWYRAFSRPGGNITGMSLFSMGRWPGSVCELLRELMPSGNAFAYLINPANPSAQARTGRGGEGCGGDRRTARGGESQHLRASWRRPLPIWRAMKIAGVIVAGEPFFDSRREMIVALARPGRIPASLRLARECRLPADS